MAREATSYGAGTRDTLVAALDRAAGRCPDEIFFDIEGDGTSFGDFDRLTTRLGNALIARGLNKGDRLVTMCATHADAMAMWFAAAKTGAIWVPVNLAYRREFLRHQMSDAGGRIAICDREYLDRIIEIADQLPTLERILCRGDVRDLPASPIPIEAFDDYRGHDDTPIDRAVEPADLVALIYTSGTTGPSKGCMISHNYLCMQGRQQERGIDLSPGVTTWTPLPLFHAAAITALMGGLIVGTRVSLNRNFSVTSFWEDIERSGATRVFLMASALPLVAFAPDTPAMKRCFGQIDVLMGIPLPPDIRRIWEERFGVRRVLPSMYGQTEINRLTMMPFGEDAPDFSIGREAAEFEVAILDADDLPVPPDVVGEICCRPRFANVMFEGYWRRPEDTARAWRNLWMHTGDLGRKDAQGFLYFVDRAKDYLRCRGENISSFEVESAFLNHPDIVEAALHSASTALTEDDIKITIVVNAGTTSTERDICLWAIDNLPYFAVPRYFEFRSELIKTPTGRVLKYRLREEGVTPTTWDREAHGIQVRRTTNG